MENNHTLVNLPLEVIEIVAGYLSIRDLLACCSCSKSMREIFNDDSIWRPRCNKKLCEYLRATPCKVKPHFELKSDENSLLSGIPQWKVSFMYQNHLWNNWRQGRKWEEVIRSQESDRSATISLDDDSLFHLFLTSDCIIAVYPDRIEILDVRESPAAKASSDILLPKNLSREVGFKVLAGDGVVVIIYYTLVLVYHVNFSTKESILKNVFYVEDSQATANVHGAEDLKRLLECAKLTGCKSLVNTGLVGDLLIGVYRGKSSMHIWDIKSGLKITTQDCPIKNSHIVEFKGTDTMNLILCLEEQKCLATQNNSQTFLAYNLKTFSFLPFSETFMGSCEFTTNNKYVAIWVNCVLNIYDYVKCKHILGNQHIDSFCRGFRIHFVFIDHGILKIFRPSEEMLKPIFLSPKLLNTSIIVDFEILEDKFIHVIKTYPDSRFRLSPPTFMVYEFYDEIKWLETKLNLMFNPCSFFLNATSTRYIDRDECVNVIHFW